MEWTRWGKQSATVGPRKCNQNTFSSFSCKWFLQLPFSLCLCPALCLPHYWKGGISVSLHCASGGGSVAVRHAELGRGNGWPCLTSVWLSLLGAAAPAVLSCWFSLCLDAFAVYFSKATWLLSWGLLRNLSPWQAILQFDTEENWFLLSFL